MSLAAPVVTAEQDGQARLEEQLGVAQMVAFRQLHGDAERAATRDDRDLVQRVGLRHVQRDQGVARLVIGGELLLLVRHGHRTPLGAHQHLVLGVLEVGHGDQALADARGAQRRLVDEVGEIGTGEARRAARQHARIDVGRQRHLAHVDLEDLLAAADVRVGHHDLAVEAAGPQQCRIEHVGTVGGSDQDDAFVRLEAVHLDQQLIQRLLTLVVAAAQSGAAMTADCVDFVDEHDAGRVLLGLLEHVAHAGGADTDEHLDKVGARDGEERDVGLTGDGAGQQGLAGARRADQQAALGDLAAQALELLRVLQEVDDLLELGLGLVDAGHILEGYAAVLLGQQAGARLAKTHRATGAALHLAQEKDVDADQNKDRQPAHEDRADVDALFRRTGIDAVDVLDQHRHQLLIGRRRRHIGRELLHAVARLAEAAGDGIAGDADFLHLTLLDGVDEVGIGNRIARRARRASLEDAVEQRQQEDDDDPQSSVTIERVHGTTIRRWGYDQDGAARAARKRKMQPG